MQIGCPPIPVVNGPLGLLLGAPLETSESEVFREPSEAAVSSCHAALLKNCEQLSNAPDTTSFDMTPI